MSKEIGMVRYLACVRVDNATSGNYIPRIFRIYSTTGTFTHVDRSAEMDHKAVDAGMLQVDF